MTTKLPAWFLLTMLNLLLNGLWGALIELPEKRLSPPFPTSLGYVVWSLTFVPCAAYALWRVGWRLDVRLGTVWRGLLVGLLGGAGQFVLFEGLRVGPAYLIFPIVSVFPLITIVLSVLFLRERVNAWAGLGIALAFGAVVLLSIQEPGPGLASGYLWLWLTVAAFVMWGVQAFYAKLILRTIDAESVFFYIMVSNLVFIPLAVHQTDFSQPIGWGAGLWLTVAVQSLNAVSVLLLVHAQRTGKIIIIGPLASLAPTITTILSLVIYQRFPYIYNLYGMVLSVLALGLITYGELSAPAIASPASLTISTEKETLS